MIRNSSSLGDILDEHLDTQICKSGYSEDNILAESETVECELAVSCVQRDWQTRLNLARTSVSERQETCNQTWLLNYSQLESRMSFRPRHCKTYYKLVWWSRDWITTSGLDESALKSSVLAQLTATSTESLLWTVLCTHDKDVFITHVIPRSSKWMELRCLTSSRLPSRWGWPTGARWELGLGSTTRWQGWPCPTPPSSTRRSRDPKWSLAVTPNLR